jgi:hypothetical protein
VCKPSAGFTPALLVGFVVGRLTLECSQQDCADECEHGAYGEYIPLQGKVHGSAPLVEEEKS